MPDKSQREELKAKMKERGPRLQRHRRQPVGREADQHRRSVQVHRRVPEELRVRARPRHSGHPRRQRAAADDPSRGRLRNRDGSRGARPGRPAADIAADHGQYVTWEFEPGFAFNKPTDIVRVHDAVNKPNFGLQYDTCHGQMVGVVGARQEGGKEIFPTQVEFIRMLDGRINHIHLIDSDNTCHKDANGERRDLRASAVRPRRPRLRRDRAGTGQSRRAARTTGGPSTSASGPTPGRPRKRARRRSTSSSRSTAVVGRTMQRTSRRHDRLRLHGPRPFERLQAAQRFLSRRSTARC